MISKRFVGTSKWPYAIEFGLDIDIDVIEEMYQWCREQYGHQYYITDKEHDSFWLKSWDGVRFKQKEHRDWFILRWS